MNDEKLMKKIEDKKLKVEKSKAAIDAETRRMEKIEQEILFLQKKQKEVYYNNLDLMLLKKEIKVESIDQEQLVQLILENISVLIDDKK